MPQYEVSHAIELQVSPQEIWPYLAHTDALNRELGLPIPEFRYHALEGSGNIVEGEIKLLGLTIRYREHPFEWVRPHYYFVRRTFQEGPMQWAILGSEVEPTPTGCRIRSYCTFETTPVFRAALSVKLKQSLIAMDRVLRRFEETIKQTSVTAYTRQINQHPADPARLLAATGKLTALGHAVSCVERLTTFLATEPDPRVAEFRARDLGDGESHPWITLCLDAVRIGLLNLEWRVMCPYCRSNRQTSKHLDGIHAEAHCPGCNIGFDAAFDENVEVVFSVHPTVRAAVAASFCIGGPELAHHVAAQWVLQPSESRAIRLPEVVGTAIGRSLRPQSRQTITIGPIGTQEVTLPLQSDILHLNPDGPLRIENPTQEEQVWRWEDSGTLPLATTAAEVTSLQAFRDQFASEVLAPGEQIAVRSVVILFTDLKGSTRMYRDEGDALSYARVRRHFEVLKAAIAAHHGAVVKTIGDAVMASFRSVEDALAASRLAHEQMASAVPEICMKMGLHQGPALAVEANGTLDYFGRTVNQAARLQKFSLGDDLVMLASILPPVDGLCDVEHFIADVPDIGDQIPLVRLTFLKS